MIFFLEGAAALCAAYFALLAVNIGIRGSFLFIWPVFSALFLLSAGVVGIFRTRSVSQRVRVTVITAAAAAVVLFFGTSLVIASYSYGDYSGSEKYGIVLGARVNDREPGDALTRRLESAYIWASEHPETVLILSGGQGEGEDVTEADAMETWLCDRGIPETRILKDPVSRDTREEILLSLRLMNPGENAVVITDGYHLFRARKIAEKEGACLSGLPARTNPLFGVHFWVREIFAVWKDKYLGRM